MIICFFNFFFSVTLESITRVSRYSLYLSVHKPIGSSSTTNTYGNSIKSEALNNGTTSRDLEVKNGSTFGLMIRGFLGAEYFIAPKISISAELGWGIGLSSSGDASTSSETYDFGDDTSSNSSTTTPGDSSFNITNDLGVSNGVLGLTLHF